MYDVLDICRYVINYSHEENYSISNLKLQKLLYFIQAYFLIMKNAPCFNAKIEAWDFGPVIPEAYQEYKQYSAYNIPRITSFYKVPDETSNNIIFSTEEVPYEDNIIKDEDKKLIEEVVNKFSNYSATDLVTLTHNQDPWDNIYEPNQNNEITIDSIKRYFNGEI